MGFNLTEFPSVAFRIHDLTHVLNTPVWLKVHYFVKLKNIAKLKTQQYYPRVVELEYFSKFIFSTIKYTGILVQNM